MVGKKAGFTLLVFFLFFLLVSGSKEALSQLSFTITPIIQEMVVSPGETKTFRLSVFTTISRQEKMHFLVYPADFRLDREGEIEFFEPGSIKRSAASWIKIEPAEFIVGPNETKDIKVTITVPRNVSGGYYAAILVQLLPEIPPGMKIGTVRSWRMASIVELTVSGWKKPRADINISDLKVEPSKEKKSLVFTVSVENKGDVHTRVEGNLVITTKQGRKLAELPLKAGRGTVFPESTRDFKAILEKELPQGEYFATAVLNYENKSARSRVSFSVGEALSKGEEVAKEKEINFFVTPEIAEINAPSGSTRTINFTFVNGGKNVIHCRLHLKDVQINPDGEVMLLKAGSTPFSCSDWIELKESEFDLGPLQRRNVLGLLKIPEGVVGGRYARLAVEVSESRGEKNVITIPETMIAVLVGKEFQTKGEISKLQLVHKGNVPSEFLVSFKNTGDIHLKVRGNLVVKDKTGNVVMQLSLSKEEMLVLPGSIRNFRVALPEPLQKGDYVVEVKFFSQRKELVAATKKISITR